LNYSCEDIFDGATVVEKLLLADLSLLPAQPAVVIAGATVLGRQSAIFW